MKFVSFLFFSTSSSEKQKHVREEGGKKCIKKIICNFQHLYIHIVPYANNKFIYLTKSCLYFFFISRCRFLCKYFRKIKEKKENKKSFSFWHEINKVLNAKSFHRSFSSFIHFVGANLVQACCMKGGAFKNVKK